MCKSSPTHNGMHSLAKQVKSAGNSTANNDALRIEQIGKTGTRNPQMVTGLPEDAKRLKLAPTGRSRDGIGTIMAGACATKTLVPLFSSPALTYSYRQDGADEDTDISLGSETADCVRAMSNNAPLLAGLNDRRADPLGEHPDQAPQIADLADTAGIEAVSAGQQ